MYQWSVVSIFVVSVLVGQVHPTPLKEQLNSSVLNVTSVSNGTDVLIKKSTETIVPQPQEKNEEGNSSKSNKTEVAVSPARMSTGNESTSIERKDGQEKEGHTCHYTKETVDMVKCFVMPHDDDDEITDTAKRANSTVPQKEDTRKDNKPLSDQESLKNTAYHTASPNANKNAKTNLTGSADVKGNNNRTEATVSSVEPLLTDNVQDNENSGNSGEVTKSQEKKNMPSGVIVLVVAVTFVLAIGFAYISVIGWRRYVEYKYGHRELLVNDLEFDTNDLRHFEL